MLSQFAVLSPAHADSCYVILMLPLFSTLCKRNAFNILCFRNERSFFREHRVASFLLDNGERVASDYCSVQVCFKLIGVSNS